MHKLNDELKTALNLNKGYVQISNTLFHQVSVDYELLKKALGYPSENIFSVFIRMTNEQRFDFILSYLNTFGFIVFVVISIYKSTHDISKSTNAITFLSFIVLVVLNFFYVKKNNSKSYY